MTAGVEEEGAKGPGKRDSRALSLSSLFLIASGAGWLLSGLLNLAALAATRLGRGRVVPGAMYPLLDVDGWMFFLLCVLSFSLMGVIGLGAGWGILRKRYWARSLALSFSIMAAVSGALLATYTYPTPGVLLALAHLVFVVYLVRSREMERAFPVWVSRHARGASQFSLLFLLNATAVGSLVIAPMLPLLRFRHMSGGSYGVPLCSLGSISRCLSGNWADLLLAPVILVAILMLVGLLVGRALCGWACPIGFLQDLAVRVKGLAGAGDVEPSRRAHELLRLVKYAILLFVLLLALNIGIAGVLSPDAQGELVSGLSGFPLFQSGATPCEACPAPITGYFLPDDLITNGLAGRFVMTPEAALRLFVLVGFVIGALLMPRFFCRYFCPAGAMAALFNKVSALSIEKDQERCTDCGYCVTACPMRITRLRDERVDSRVHDTECTFCLECVDSCPERALSLSFQGRSVYSGGKEWWLRTLRETGPPSGELEETPAPPTAGPPAIGGGRGGQPPGKEGRMGTATLLVLLIAASLITPALMSTDVSGREYGPGNLPPANHRGDRTLSSGDRLIVRASELTINGSLILEENASVLISEGSTVTINGDLWLSGKSSLRIENSTLRIRVPEEPPMRIEELYLAPSGFVLVEEDASMWLSGARLEVSRLQETLMHGIVSPGFGGIGESYTYRITYTDPQERPPERLVAVIDGEPLNMTKEDPDDTTFRDGVVYRCEAVLPAGNHSYHFECEGPDGTLRYPREGEIPGPHVGTDEPIFLFGSEMLVSFGTVEALSSTIDMEGTLYTHMDSRLTLERSSLRCGLTIEINPLCVFTESNVQSMVVKERTGAVNVILRDCTVGTAVIESVSGALFERCTIETLDMQSESRTTVISSTVRFLSAGGNASALLDASTVTATEFPHMRLGGDCCVTAINGTRLGLVHMHERARLYLTASEVGRLEAHDDARVWSEGAAIKEQELSGNATILNTMRLRATVNGRPAIVEVEVISPGGELLVSTTTREYGYRSFAVPTRVIRPSGTEELERCTIRVRYMSLESVTEHNLSGSPEVNVSLEDLEPPRIDDIEFDYYFRTEGEALVRARVSDGGGSGVSRVEVAYSVDGGRERWARLYHIGGGLYEGTIVDLKGASEVRFRVVTSDWMNNTSSSSLRAVVVGAPPWASGAALALVAAVIALAAGRALLERLRLRRFVRGGGPREADR